MVSFFAGLLAFLFAISVLIIIGMVMGIPVMFCWNMTMPHIFNLPQIDIYQGMGLWFLSFLLIKNQEVSKNV